MADVSRPGSGASSSVAASDRETRSRLQIEADFRNVEGRRNLFNYWKRNAGIRVTLFNEPGITSKNVLSEPFRFQVPPLEEFTQQFSFDHAEYTTIRGGTYTRPAARQLTQIQFQTLFVDWNPSWAAFHLYKPNPIDETKDLRSILNTGTAFRMVIRNPDLWGYQNDVNMLAVLKALTVTEKNGEPDARYVDLTFQEYRPPAAINRKQLGKKTKPGSRPPRSLPKTPTTVLIQFDGAAYHSSRVWTYSDPVTLSKLSTHFYGSAVLWRYIAAKNGIINVSGTTDLGTYVKRLYPGDKPAALARRTKKLVIPKLASGQ
jgi:hypothetical protein